MAQIHPDKRRRLQELILKNCKMPGQLSSEERLELNQLLDLADIAAKNYPPGTNKPLGGKEVNNARCQG